MTSLSQKWANRLVVFAKAPLMGKAKTRLAKDVGPARAACFYRNATAKLLSRVDDPRWQTVLALDPPSIVPGGLENLWPPNLPRIGQGTGDLGARMGNMFSHLPPGPLMIIGSDCPGITTHHIAQGFAQLRGSDAVFGPAIDGGYWLIGLARRRAAPQLFDQVRWSTEHALSDTQKTLPGHFRISQLPPLSDVDHGEDLAAQPFALVRSKA